MLITKTCLIEFLNAIEEINRKKLKVIEFLNFLLAVDSTQLMWIEKDLSYWVFY